MDTLLNFTSFLTLQGSVLAVGGVALGCHFIFKRFEPHDLVSVFFLLVVIPLSLTPLFFSREFNVTSACLITFLVYHFTLGISIVIYRVSPWHPLSRYPGPIICKLSKLWLAGIAIKGKQYLYYHELHEQYGDIVRIGPNELSIRDPAAIAPMMGPKGIPKGPGWDGRIPKKQLKPLIALRDTQEHARRRRPWNRAFTSGALKGYEPTITRRALQLVNLLEQHGNPVDVAQWMSYFTNDFMNDMAFGGGTEMMQQGDSDGLLQLLRSGLRTEMFVTHVPWLGAITQKLPFLRKDMKAFRAYAIKRATMRWKHGSSTKDIFYHLIDEGNLEPNPPTLAEVISDGALAIIAGSDTTATVLSNIFWLLVSSPVAYGRLQAEVDELGDSVLDTSRHARMPYLNAVINEALRLFPPVLSGSQRATVKGGGGKSIGSYYVPEGTSAFVPFYSLHRDPRNFSPLPDSFLPERWLPHKEQISLEPRHFKGSEKVVHNTAAFVPFSLGPAVCVGKNLAYQEMRIVVCLIIHKFNMSFADGFDSKAWEDDMRDYQIVTMQGKLPVVLSSRKSK